jgi:predicted esterase
LELLTNRAEAALLRDQVLLQTRFGTHAAIAAGSTISEELDVNYGGDNGAEELILDLQWPNEVAPAGGWPAVIALHGNGQTKASMYYFCRRRVKAGRLCMAPDRRILQGYEKPDSKLAIEWLFANAAKYNVNVNKVVLYGYSKGGFITNNLIWKDPEIEEKTAAVIIASGVGAANVDSAHAEGPPLLLISCENDNVVMYKQTEAMYDKLVGFGSDVTLWTCHNGHGSQKAEGFDEQVDAFLDRVVPVTGELSTPDQGGVATTAGPTTTTSTKAPIAPKCVDWCANHSPTVSCEWDSCSGCDGCFNA